MKRFKGIKMNFKKEYICFFIILSVLFCIAGVSASDANDINATDTSISTNEEIQEIKQTDNIEPISATDEGTFTALQNKINNASEGTITLENDYAYDSGFNIDGINIDKSITIKGNGHTIDASSQSRIFKLSANNIVLENIIFKNGNSESGGAIYATGDYCTIQSCTFKNCSAYNGGAIYGKEANNLNISSSLFEGNNAKSYGGAIHILCNNANIENNEFESNVADNGGAIYINTFTERRVVSVEYIPGHYEENTKITIYDYAYGQIVGSHHPKEWVSATYRNKYGDVTVGNDVKVSNNIFNRNSLNEGTAIIDKGTDTKIENNTNGETSIYKSTIYVNNKNTEITNNKFDWERKVQPGEGTPSTNTQSGNGTSSTNPQSDANKQSAKALKTVKITAKNKKFKKAKKIKKYTVTVKSNKKAVKNLKITLKIKGKTYTAKTNSKGKATFKIKKLTKKGTYKATITFKGNSNYKKVTKTVKIKVK